MFKIEARTRVNVLHVPVSICDTLFATLDHRMNDFFVVVSFEDFLSSRTCLSVDAMSGGNFACNDIDKNRMNEEEKKRQSGNHTKSKSNESSIRIQACDE